MINNCDICFNAYRKESKFVILSNTICICQECIRNLNAKASTVYRTKSKPKLVNGY